MKKYKNMDKEELIALLESYQEQIDDYHLLLGLRNKRSLIKKFDDDYNKEDLKKKPDRAYCYIMPDAEEVYRRYYKQKKILSKLKKDITHCLKHGSINKLANDLILLDNDIYDEDITIDKII